jgi:hypothetical membrane protein
MPRRFRPTMADPAFAGALSDPLSRDGSHPLVRAPSEPAVRRVSTARRVLATVGAAGPVVFLAVTVLAGLLEPGYDIREQAISDLAVGARGWLQTANFFALGVAMIASALALAPGCRQARRSPSAVVLLAGAGAGMFTVGLFPTDLAGAPQTGPGAIHNAVSVGVFLALIVAAALHGRALRRAGAEPGLARYLRLTAIGVFAVLVVFALFAGDVGDPLHDVSGLIERVFVAGALAWITVVSRRLLATQ